MLHTTAELAWNFKDSTLKPGMSVGIFPFFETFPTHHPIPSPFPPSSSLWYSQKKKHKSKKIWQTICKMSLYFFPKNHYSKTFLEKF
jgi:hypothetical protein